MKACLSDPPGAEGMLVWHRNTVTLPETDLCRIIIFYYLYHLYSSGTWMWLISSC